MSDTAVSVHSDAALALTRLYDYARQVEAERDRLRGVLVRIRTGEADDPRGAARAALGEQT